MSEADATTKPLSEEDKESSPKEESPPSPDLVKKEEDGGSDPPPALSAEQQQQQQQAAAAAPAPPPVVKDEEETTAATPAPAPEAATSPEAPGVASSTTNTPINEATPAAASEAAEEATSSTTTTTTTASPPAPPPGPGNNNNNIDPDVFPCIEQPIRLALHCRNGYYLWGLRNGRVIARKKRSEKDEFRVNYIDANAGIVEIINHKFGGVLQVVVPTEEEKAKGQVVQTKVVCIKDEKNKNKEENKEEEQETTTTSNGESNNAPSEDATTTATEEGTTAAGGEAEEDEEEGFEDEPAVAAAMANTEAQQEDRQWCFVRGAHGEGVLLKSLRTGENLAVDNSGNIILEPSDESRTGVCMTWDMECVTGELCFLSNPRLVSSSSSAAASVTASERSGAAANPVGGKRIRCDMAGLLSLTDAWKGWEVFRIMETGTHHYVKISSWMHSQWFLCSTAQGDVTCCSHAESLKSKDDNRGRCSQWAIEKAPPEYYTNTTSTSSVGGEGQQQALLGGVIIRSKSHGRLLCVKDGELRTYNPNNINNTSEEEDRTEELLKAAAAQSSGTPMTMDNAANAAKDWWNNSVRSMNQSMRKVKKRMSDVKKSTTSNASGSGGPGADGPPEDEVIPQSETLVWQLEAAHSQTYYFLNVGENPKQPRSIGPFPYATNNLRQTDKIQLKRTADCCKLYLTEKEQYVSCDSEGNVSLVYVYPDDDKNTEWIMEKPSYQEGGSVYRHKHHNLYLSYVLSNDGEAQSERPQQQSEMESSSGGHGHHFKNPFGGKPEPVAQLMGIEFIGPRTIWKLEPCMPRAVSSEKIKTFALGTSIAVGTTIAMPFALAGAGAVLGAVGAEAGVLFNAIAVTLTGAEALASVGAIGATAYIVFRPEENSLTDDHKRDDEEEGERAWSKRPFSNWRNW